MISVRGLVKRYGRSDITLHGVDLDVEDGQFFTLLGPSGCGKTTLLRCIAGLEQAEGGRIAINNRAMLDPARRIFVEPNHRNIGMVFQSYAIWPHMTVLENVAFPARVRQMPNAEDAAVKALAIVGLEHLKDRGATKLSGGQQQRVALARAIATKPDVLLLDEPLSNLDAGLRDQMRSELRRLQVETGLTTVLVTHDQAEALSLSDKIAVMDQGRIVEIASPEDVYSRPRHAFTARFFGDTIELGVELTQLADGKAMLASKLGSFVLPAPHNPPGPVSMFLRTERFHLRSEAARPGDLAFPARVEARRFLGAGYEYDMVADDAGIRFQMKNGDNARFDVGHIVSVQFDADAAMLVARH